MFFFNKLFTKISAVILYKYVGQDLDHNKYYIHRFNKTSVGKKRRFCLYNKISEPTKVPALWHGWLHYSTDTIPTKSDVANNNHKPNLTGTMYAFKPHKKETKHYSSWK